MGWGGGGGHACTAKAFSLEVEEDTVLIECMVDGKVAEPDRQCVGVEVSEVWGNGGKGGEQRVG